MTDPLLTLPLDAIDADALPRDRSGIDPEPLEELTRSIRAHGLRQPVEVFASPEGAAHPYGLISGYRRLLAVRALAAEGFPGFDGIPAFLRAPADACAALAAMIEENEIRAGLSPWEQGQAVVRARDTGHFPTLDAAVDGLHPSVTRTRRSRLRALAHVVDELGGLLRQPERLTLRQLLRLAGALRGGFEAELEDALDTSRARTAAGQWAAVEPILREFETEPEPAPDLSHRRRGRPRRLARLRPGLTVRRERAPEGWTLRFTGPEATGPLLEEVMAEILRLYGGR